MKQITAKEFYNMSEKNPSVFEHWETPLEIMEFVYCNNSKITHLSKQLTFSGKNQDGWFAFCKSLKIATGTFHGRVYFSDSGIQKISQLLITNPDNADLSANFSYCKDLKIATGNYPD
jgi:hypothetical protein